IHDPCLVVSRLDVPGDRPLQESLVGFNPVTAPPLLAGPPIRERAPEPPWPLAGVLQLREAGYLTVSEVAKELGIGTTTLQRREGTIYPLAARIGGIRVYQEVDVELLRRRGLSCCQR